MASFLSVLDEEILSKNVWGFSKNFFAEFLRNSLLLLFLAQSERFMRLDFPGELSVMAAYFHLNSIFRKLSRVANFCKIEWLIFPKKSSVFFSHSRTILSSLKKCNDDKTANHFFALLSQLMIKGKERSQVQIAKDIIKRLLDEYS